MTTPRVRIKQQNPVFSFVECKRCGNRASIGDAFKDVSGQYWCLSHKDRGMLLNWAHEHSYPAITFVGKTIKHYPVQGLPDYIAPIKYHIGFEGNKGNKDLWEINTMIGDDDLISAAIACIESRKDR